MLSSITSYHHQHRRPRRGGCHPPTFTGQQREAAGHRRTTDIQKSPHSTLRFLSSRRGGQRLATDTLLSFTVHYGHHRMMYYPRNHVVVVNVFYHTTTTNHQAHTIVTIVTIFLSIEPVLRSIIIITSPRVRRPGCCRDGRGALDIIFIISSHRIRVYGLMSSLPIISLYVSVIFTTITIVRLLSSSSSVVTVLTIKLPSSVTVICYHHSIVIISRHRHLLPSNHRHNQSSPSSLPSVIITLINITLTIKLPSSSVVTVLTITLTITQMLPPTLPAPLS